MQIKSSSSHSVGVALRLDEIIMDCADPRLLATFWARALDYEVGDSDPDIASIDDPSGAGPSIAFQRVPEAKNGKNRVHFDLSVDDNHLDEAVDRLVTLGATKIDVGQGSDRSWVVLADPEGNEFCVVT